MKVAEVTEVIIFTTRVSLGESAWDLSRGLHFFTCHSFFNKTYSCFLLLDLKASRNEAKTIQPQTRAITSVCVILVGWLI